MKPAIPFSNRHIGPDADDIREMLRAVGSNSISVFIDSVIPEAVRASRPFRPDPPMTEDEALSALKRMADNNHLYRSLIGNGYHDTIVPGVIQRNILENPGWYTQYTPYQAEIAQGRLEALLNFQTMIIDLTGLEIANASLLDEATAAAEAMTMFFGVKGRPSQGIFFVANSCHPQTIDVVRTRAKPLGIVVEVGDPRTYEFSQSTFGALVQYPSTDGAVSDYGPFCSRAHASGSLVVVAADILGLALLTPPGEFGADAAVGNTQRFGVPMGFGGPHAAYLATKDEYKRQMPGRIIGVSVDARNRPALRMALQTREQHIRREKATSNICTAQVLLAIMAGMYAVYHGPRGIRLIAERVHGFAAILAAGLKHLGYSLAHEEYFDTLRVHCDQATRNYVESTLSSRKINLRWFDDFSCGIALDEKTNLDEIDNLLAVFAHRRSTGYSLDELAGAVPDGYHGIMNRTSAYLTHPVFNEHHSETEMLRYIKSLEEKDLSLAVSMIPLGSCTMKLNATSELVPVTWPKFGSLHPFVPPEQAMGYEDLALRLAEMLQELTGFAAISFQPNSGAQGEYSGLLVIRAFQESKGEAHRNVCLIPSSAHGTNPASAVMAGMEVVIVRAKEDGTIDIADLKAKSEQHKEHLSALMVTYPSTHGVFEEGIKEICSIVHANGGQVYMDGANMNAQVGLCRPAELGADVCHLNLHKTFCIPHGGGGPGMGPIGVARHLVDFLPTHPEVRSGDGHAVGAVSASPLGSASILVISWAYIAMMGMEGLTDATRVAILNANYMMTRLAAHYPVLYRGAHGRCAHEFILDMRSFKESSGVEVEDITKRLMDYGFHAPTASFPVAGTLMIEPTESESKSELDRYCEALIAIRGEIAEIEEGKFSKEQNVLKNAPHTVDTVAGDTWNFPYSREKAAFPAHWLRERKFWPSVGRINSVYGDRNLVCACPPIEEYASEEGLKQT